MSKGLGFSPADLQSGLKKLETVEDKEASNLAHSIESIRNAHRHHPFNAMVVRSVGKQEMLANPDAMKAMDGEFDGLTRTGVWDLKSVREFDDVASEARRNNLKVHFGRVFGICGEKGSELPIRLPRK